MEHRYAGFHCSWCYDAEGIRWKLLAAQRDDRPRWGDYADKLRLDYIESLVENGVWFDGSRPFFSVQEQLYQPARGGGGGGGYAPASVLAQRRRYAHLLLHPASRRRNNATENGRR